MAIYAAVMPSTPIATAKTLLRLSAPSTGPIYVLRAWCKSAGAENSNQVNVQIQRVTSDGTGTTGTARQLDGSGGTYGGSFVYNLTAEPTLDHMLIEMPFNLVGDAFEWVPTPLEQIVVPASGRIALELTEAPASSQSMVAGFTIQTTS